MVRNLKQIIREEINDFEWAKDDLPPFYTLEWSEHPMSKSSTAVWDALNFADGVGNTFKDLKFAKKDLPNGEWISLISGPNWIPSAFDDNPIDPLDVNSDRLGDRFEVMSSQLDEPRIMTKDEVNSHMQKLIEK